MKSRDTARCKHLYTYGVERNGLVYILRLAGNRGGLLCPPSRCAVRGNDAARIWKAYRQFSGKDERAGQRQKLAALALLSLGVKARRRDGMKARLAREEVSGLRRSRIATMAETTEVPAAQAKHDIADLAIAGVTGLMLAYTVLFLCVLPMIGKLAGGRDFVIYWATGQQLVHHANPYDSGAMQRIEQGAGLGAEFKVGFMRNPPWAMALVYPLGLIGLRTGAFLWSLLLLGLLAVSVLLLWRMHGRPGSALHWLGLSFAPALLCVSMGQTSLFALLGYVLFLRLHRTHPFSAGISLWLCALKPHLFLAFGAVLLAWVLVSRSYRVLAGAAVALAASCAAVFCIDPAMWSQYAQMMRTYGIEKEPIPCLSILLRLWINPQAMWLQYLPAALGCVLALGFFWTRRHRWDWMKDGSLVMLVSVLTAPYSWIFDESLAIPALLQGAYLTRLRPLLTVLAAASVVIEIELMSGFKLFSTSYIWTAPFWRAWYLCATGIRRRPTEEAEAAQ